MSHFPFNHLSDEELGTALSETSSWTIMPNATHSIYQFESDLMRGKCDPDINCFSWIKQSILSNFKYYPEKDLISDVNQKNKFRHAALSVLHIHV